MLRPKTSIDSVKFALHGILHAFRTQRHVRFHFWLGILVLLLGIVWRLPRLELLFLLSAIVVVVITEMLNTAVEAVVDLVTTAYHPLAKLAKDVAAGAVLLASLYAAIVGIVLFFNPDHIELVLGRRVAVDPGRRIQLLVVACVVLMALLVIWKVRGGRGTFLHGGVVSGHAAIGFCLCTVIVLSTPEPFVWLIAILLALLTAQSRVEAGVHSIREVAFGAALGILVPVLVIHALPLVTHRLAVPAPRAGIGIAAPDQAPGPGG